MQKYLFPFFLFILFSISGCDFGDDNTNELANDKCSKKMAIKTASKEAEKYSSPEIELDIENPRISIEEINNIWVITYSPRDKYMDGGVVVRVLGGAVSIYINKNTCEIEKTQSWK